MKTKRVLILSFFLLTLLNSRDLRAQASDPYLGQIAMVPYNFAPRGWALCNGQLLPIAQNTALFSLLGTQFGGNGQTTFALPDLRGRVAVHAGQGPGLTSRSVGEIWGGEQTTLLQNNMPMHIHPATATASTIANTAVQIHASKDAGTVSDPTDAFWGNTGSLDREYGTTTNATMNSSAATATTTATTTATVTVGPAGGSQPFNISPPSLGIYYIISLQGVFPSRD